MRSFPQMDPPSSYTHTAPVALYHPPCASRSRPGQLPHHRRLNHSRPHAEFPASLPVLSPSAKVHKPSESPADDPSQHSSTHSHTEPERFCLRESPHVTPQSDAPQE